MNEKKLTVCRGILCFAVALALALSALAIVGCSSKTQEVKLKVDATAAVEKGWNKDAIIFDDTVTVPENGNVNDALEASKIVYSISGGYVTAIEGLGEGEYGETSGWSYTINGEYPTEGVEKSVLSANDEVVFVYVTEFTSM